MKAQRLFPLLLVGAALASTLAWQRADAALQPPDEDSAEAVEAQCAIEGQERDLTGKALSASVLTCVKQEAPDLGVWATCRARGRDGGLKGDVLKGFVTDCLNAAP